MIGRAVNGEINQDRVSVWQPAIDRWLAGLAFAVVVSTAVIGAASLPLVGSVFRSIEAGGIDAAMRTRLALFPRDPIGAGDEPSSFVFVDLDTRSCMALEHSAWCATRSPASPGVAARTAVAVLGAEPRIVMIDVRLWDVGQNTLSYGEDFRRLAAAAANHPQSRVLAVAPLRPGERTGEGVIETSLIPTELRGTPVKFAPALVWDEGDVLRRYPRAILQRTDDGVWKPQLTLPALAAAYVLAGNDDKRRSEIDCLSWPRPSAATGSCHSGSGLADLRVQQDWPLLLFTLPSLARSEGGPRPDAARVFQNLYDWYPSSDVVTGDGALKIRPALLAGKIVVIGTSAHRALDWYRTPVGSLAGAEILLNATRAFAAHAELEEPALAGKLLREWLFALIGSLPFLGFWLLVSWTGRISQAGRSGPVISALVACALFPVTIGASALVMIFFAFWQASGVLLGGHTWDLFTPLAALSLEAFADAGKTISEFLEHKVQAARRALAFHSGKLVRGFWRRGK